MPSSDPRTTMEFEATNIHRASTPEDLFGNNPNYVLADIQLQYRRLSKLVHPDLFLEDGFREMAEEAFKKLNTLNMEAERKIAAGTYGKPIFVITTKTGTYQVEKYTDGDDITVTYDSAYNGLRRLLKVARLPQDRDLLQSESSSLKLIVKNYPKLAGYYPDLVESLDYTDNTTHKSHAVNVFNPTAGSWYSAKELHKLFLVGMDLKDIAWITRRVLIALSAAHDSGIIHGAVLPENVLVEPEQHGAMLVNWCYSVKHPDVIKAVPSDYVSWYPESVIKKEATTPAVDFHLMAHTMHKLMGVTTSSGMKETEAFRAFFNGCRDLLVGGMTAQELLKEFDILLERMWGPPKFHALVIPK